MKAEIVMEIDVPGRHEGEGYFEVLQNRYTLTVLAITIDEHIV